MPVILEPLSPDQLQIPQSPVQQIFETVIEPDLTDAAINLPAKLQGCRCWTGHTGAATALLAKAYLFQRNGIKPRLLQLKLSTAICMT